MFACWCLVVDVTVGDGAGFSIDVGVGVSVGGSIGVDVGVHIVAVCCFRDDV